MFAFYVWNILLLSFAFIKESLVIDNVTDFNAGWKQDRCEFPALCRVTLGIHVWLGSISEPSEGT